MITILADHNIEGQALLLWGALSAGGWLDFFPMQLVFFTDVGLPEDSTDREVWRFAQTNQMIILTDNRNMDGPDSLEQTMREENTLTSLPILTIGRTSRITQAEYRERCAIRIMEIAMELDDNLGVGRLFIP